MLKADKHKKVEYQDKWLIILGVPIVNLLNYYLTFPSLALNSHFYFTVFVDTLLGYSAWYSCRSIIFILDRHYPWDGNLFKRLIIQVPLVFATLFVVVTGVTETVSYIIQKYAPYLVIYPFDIYLFIIWGFFLNVLYLSLYLYNNLNAPFEKSIFGSKIWIKIGKRHHPIDLDEAICFYEEFENAYIVMPDGKSQPVPGYSLNRLEKLADESKFFRANRQFLISRDIVKNIRRVNGKLAVTLFPHPGLPPEITVRRFRTSAFQQWMKAPQTTSAQ